MCVRKMHQFPIPFFTNLLSHCAERYYECNQVLRKVEMVRVYWTSIATAIFFVCGNIPPACPQQFPNNQFPNSQVPNNQFPNSQLPNTHFPNNQLPNNQFPNSQLPNTHFPNNQLPNNQFPNSQLPNNQFPNSQLPNNQFPNSQLPNNHFFNNQLPNNNHLVPNHQIPPSYPGTRSVAFMMTKGMRQMPVQPGMQPVGSTSINYRQESTKVNAITTPSSGVFTVQVPGVYVFTISAHASATSSFRVILRRNNDIVALALAPQNQMESETIVVTANAGDHVFPTLEGDIVDSTFAGFLIIPMSGTANTAFRSMFNNGSTNTIDTSAPKEPTTKISHRPF